MNHVFHSFLHHFVLVLFDDILIYGKSWQAHLIHLNQVLHLLSKNQFFLKQSKCAFGASKVEYLSHIVGKDGTVNPKKIEAMNNWPHPKNIKSLYGFLDLTRYYCRFVQNYDKIVVPLTTLLQENSFSWTSTVDQSFQALKEAMCMTLVLALPDFTKTFVMECDSSRKVIGATLTQDGRPLDFTSKQIFERHLGLWHPNFRETLPN
jgi:hypothetical protein